MSEAGVTVIPPEIATADADPAVVSVEASTVKAPAAKTCATGFAATAITIVPALPAVSAQASRAVIVNVIVGAVYVAVGYVVQDRPLPTVDTCDAAMLVPPPTYADGNVAVIVVAVPETIALAGVKPMV